MCKDSVVTTRVLGVVQRVKLRAKKLCGMTKDNLSPIFCELLYLIDDNDRFHWIEFAR
ncbi:unnamed protein product [Soboliphyme baturini]|uniref:Uncharacterized protein n=1 Tax=Soboliphyme baturini TaxID=241478 RepID=A0A183J7W6_9BILA|nr:unnamed protein product [Soboliphyme baturini]